MVLPVIVREMRARARSGLIAYVRMAAAGLFLLVSGPVWLLGNPSGGTTGGMLFGMLGWVLMAFVLFEGARVASGTISEERREGTLGLLFLTNLSALDVLLAKLAGAALTAFYALLAMVPVLALVLLLGGVTGGELARGAAALTVAMGVSLSAGLWASARCRDWVVSLLIALATTVAAVMTPLVTELLVRLLVSGTANLEDSTVGLASPAMTLMLVPEGAYASARHRFWAGLGLQSAVIGSLVIAASRSLQRTWRDVAEVRPGIAPGPSVPVVEPPRIGEAPGPANEGLSGHGSDLRRGGVEGPWAWGSDPEVVVRRAFSRRLRLGFWGRILVAMVVVQYLPQCLVPWLTMGGGTGGGTVAVLGIMLGLVSLPAMFCGLGVTLVLVYLAARAMGEARHVGELELLLTTPLGPEAYLAHLWHGFRRVILRLVAAGSLMACLAGFASWWAIWSSAGPIHGPSPVLLLVQALAAVVTGGLTKAALVWVGFWLSLRMRRLPMAIGLTFVLVAIATPAVTQAFQFALYAWYEPGLSGTGMEARALLGLLVSAAGPALWWRWAHRRLVHSFRDVVTGRGR